MRCAVALTTRALSYRGPTLGASSLAQHFAGTGEKNHYPLLYMYPCSEPNSSVRDKTYISNSSAVVLRAVVAKQSITIYQLIAASCLVDRNRLPIYTCNIHMYRTKTVSVEWRHKDSPPLQKRKLMHSFL
jgi:hypothetical protein